MRLGDLVGLVWSRNYKHWRAKGPCVDIKDCTEIRQFEPDLMRKNMAMDVFWEFGHNPTHQLQMSEGWMVWRHWLCETSGMVCLASQKKADLYCRD